jgi:hypothetical protein
MNVEKAVVRLTEVIRRKHLAIATERSRRAWHRRYCDFLKGIASHLPNEQTPECFRIEKAKEGWCRQRSESSF